MNILVLILSLLVVLPVWGNISERTNTELTNTELTSTKISTTDKSTSKPNKSKRICAVYPHLKDSYWLSINFGMVKRAKEQKISLKVLEAGGYDNNIEQWAQIEQCLKWQADAILVGAVYYDQQTDMLLKLNKSTPLFSLVNEIYRSPLTARVGVNWYQMGAKLGEFLAIKHPKTNSSNKLKLAWFPGHKTGGGSQQATLGLQDALEHSDVEIIVIKYGLNEKIRQFSLLRETLNEFSAIDYLAGNAIMAEMAISEVAGININTRPKILSHYLSHGVYRGIVRGKILMANSDQMVLQGKMAIDQAIDYLSNKPINRQQAPKILNLTQESLGQFPVTDSLSPSHFNPVYSLTP